MSAIDLLLEIEIDKAREVFAQSQNQQEMHERWMQLASLIDLRSPEQVRAMEEARGLR